MKWLDIEQNISNFLEKINSIKNEINNAMENTNVDKDNKIKEEILSNKILKKDVLTKLKHKSIKVLPNQNDIKKIYKIIGAQKLT